MQKKEIDIKQNKDLKEQIKNEMITMLGSSLVEKVKENMPASPKKSDGGGSARNFSDVKSESSSGDEKVVVTKKDIEKAKIEVINKLPDIRYDFIEDNN